MQQHVKKFHSQAGPHAKQLQQQQQDEPSGRIPTQPAPVYSGKAIEMDKDNEDISFLHPFTMCISGPTGCGKTFIVKKILQERMVDPTPQRIIWLYRRWQPLYDEIRVLVSPAPEFIQGIPVDLDKDEFLDPKMHNLIVLDDLMSTSSKDKRVTELFTEGSHHRNLSVISINQNMYYSKDPTQRRNCHYMILFNNPADQQPIMTLARQMYPGNPQRLMDAFSKATVKPYGHLVVDLKPKTSAEFRLRPNVLQGRHVGCRKRIRGWCDYISDHSDSDDEATHIAGNKLPNKRRKMEHEQPTLACNECGAVYNTVAHLMDHGKQMHWGKPNAETDNSDDNASDSGSDGESSR